ncbi:ATP-grasp domain-containing protein [Gracilimonas mengyeensis]|uniref:Glutathione synthase/RimK-type ligase, ATP-grasp superfamily n=1 Tax=Gracilimonas mengyeensis TaxID=1302730 RepID=A0A521CVS4_9BACT|nr:hypothetical protein [Gracilimonas mengyeensis]SMO63535.1 Glutathione synthase/RimK-type ligase, ATP-grasp superfamily [Gracilimonas mengyeensis]
MPQFDIVILTESRYLAPKSPTEYQKNVLKEDMLVKDALEEKGLNVTRKDWADDGFDWNNTSTALFRTTWNYFDRFQEFSTWLDQTSTATKFINSASLTRWNTDKHYLNDLARNGIPIVPTRFISRGSGLTINELHEITGWKETVVKPTIGGGGRYTYHITPKNLEAISEKMDQLMKQEDFMLQPFQRNVPGQGEWSYMFFGERFSHAVLKKARPGDFRVQDDFGGTVHPHQPNQTEIDFALAAVKACPETPVYSRVDIVMDNNGRPAVSELELVEPELWFRLEPQAAELLADEIVGRYF